jgi:hypothetical protein
MMDGWSYLFGQILLNDSDGYWRVTKCGDVLFRINLDEHKILVEQYAFRELSSAFSGLEYRTIGGKKFRVRGMGDGEMLFSDVFMDPSRSSHLGIQDIHDRLSAEVGTTSMIHFHDKKVRGEWMVSEIQRDGKRMTGFGLVKVAR